MVCGHEWEREAEVEEEEEIGPRIVKDAFGNVLQTGDINSDDQGQENHGTSRSQKWHEVKPIRIQEDGDHEISCKMDGLSIDKGDVREEGKSVASAWPKSSLSPLIELYSGEDPDVHPP